MKKILLLATLCVVGLALPVWGQVPPPVTTPLTRDLLRTNTTTAGFRAALGFLSTNNTVITNYVGNGASITNLNADELRSGTIPVARIGNGTITTNKMDATAYEAFVGGTTYNLADSTNLPYAGLSLSARQSVTNAALKAAQDATNGISGGADITPFGVSATNTFYVINTNVITVLTNVGSFNTNQFIISGCPTTAFNVTWYWSATRAGYTNSTVPSASTTAITLKMNGGSFNNLPAITNAGTVLFAAGSALLANGSTSSEWYDGGTEVMVEGMGSLYATVEDYVPEFRGILRGTFDSVSNHVANQTDSFILTRNGTNVAVPITGIFSRSNIYSWGGGSGQPFLMGDYATFETLGMRGNPGVLGFSHTVHAGASKGVVWLGMNYGDIVLGPSIDNEGVVQLGSTGNAGNRIYLQKASNASGTYTQGFSHPLEFRANGWTGSANWTKRPGIVGFSDGVNESEIGLLRFYARAPTWNRFNADANSPNGSGYEILTMSTNSVYTTNAIPFTSELFQLKSRSSAPTAASTDGFLWNSNRVLYWTTSVKTTLVSDGR